MTSAVAQGGVNARPESIQQIRGNEGLYRSGEAAAVDTEGTPVVQVMLA